MAEITYKIWISGVVQGVNFRYNTVLIAKQLKLNGWVKNLSDGRVFVEVQGVEQQVALLIDWLHHGPSSAVVREVEVKKTDSKDKYIDFSVR